MTRDSLRRTALALVAVLAAVPAPPAAQAQSATTEFRAQFVCNDRGTLLPAAGVRVEFRQRGFDALPKWATDKTILATNADAEGRVSFRHTTEGEDSYYLRAQLSSEAVTLAKFPEPWAFFADTPTHRNNVNLQDYGTQTIPYECRVWHGLDQAYRDFVTETGRAAPYGHLGVLVGGPGGDRPSALHDLVNWPTGADPGEQPGRPTVAYHEFAHTFRHAYDGGLGHFLRDAERFDYARYHKACSKTNEGFAFNEGWAEFWAGSYRPAPNCPGLSKDDMAVEGNVAAALTELNNRCLNASRKAFVEVLARSGMRIHSFADFKRAFGTCDPAGLRDMSEPTPLYEDKGRRFSAVLRADAAAVRKRVSTLKESLPEARQEAAGISREDCHTAPCLDAVEGELRPVLLKGEIAVGQLMARTLAAQAGRPAPSRFTRAAARRADSADDALARGIGDIGEDTLRRALKAAEAVAGHDDSEQIREVVAALRADLAAFAVAGTRGRSLPAGFGFLPSATTLVPGTAPEGSDSPLDDPDSAPERCASTPPRTC